MAEPSDRLVSIGGLSEASGIAPATLRIWERRYARPVPVRLPSGHRRYTQDHVRWAKQVAEALSRGHKPSVVVRATNEELATLLAPAVVAAERPYGDLIALIRQHRGDQVIDLLDEECDRIGLRRLVTERVAPLVTAIGRAWANGALQIRHEHEASEHLETLLRRRRADVRPTATRPVVLLTTLPGEAHSLGVQMAACIATLEGAPVRVLGTSTPIEQIVAASKEMRADLVCLSVSLSSGGPDTDRRLAHLLRDLPSRMRLVVGGAGARGVRRGVRGVEYVETLEQLGELVADAVRRARRTSP